MRDEEAETCTWVLGTSSAARPGYFISILSFDLLIPHAAGDGPQDGGRGGDGGGLLHGDNHIGDVAVVASRRGRVTFVFCSS